MFHFEFPPSTGVLEVVPAAEPQMHQVSVNHGSFMPVASFADIQIGDYPPTK